MGPQIFIYDKFPHSITQGGVIRLLCHYGSYFQGRSEPCHRLKKPRDYSNVDHLAIARAQCVIFPSFYGGHGGGGVQETVC